MKNIARKRSSSVCRGIAFSVISGVTVFVAGCVYDPFYYGPPPHTHYYPDYYDYYFYPSAGVYFHFSTGYYFYRVDNRWVRSRTLPPHIKLGLYDRVKLKVKDEKPFVKYDDHIRTFKPVPYKGKEPERDVKEREANTRWYKEYEKRKDKPARKPLKKDDRDYKNPGMKR